MIKRIFLWVFCIVAVTNTKPDAYDASQLTDNYRTIRKFDFDTTAVYKIAGCTLKHQDVIIALDSGMLALGQPLQLDSDRYICHAAFNGAGRFTFSPPVIMEQDQLKRFFGDGYIDDSFESLVMMASPDLIDQLTAKFVDTLPYTKKVRDKVKKIKNYVFDDYHYDYSFELLRSVAYPIGKPYLLAALDPKHSEKLFYQYNPNLREEINLLVHHWEPGNKYMEEIISYSQYNRDESYRNINGRSKNQLSVENYLIDAKIDNKGKYTGKTVMTNIVTQGPLQFVDLFLSPAMYIDSVLDQHGRAVTLFREKLDISFKDYKTWDVNLLLPEPLMYEDTLKLSFYLRGEVIEKDMGEFYVLTGADWYPRYRGMKATFDMTFTTPKRYAFTACGNMIDEKIEGDHRISHWQMLSRASNVSFNIGLMKKRIFREKDVADVEIYFSEDIHQRYTEYALNKAYWGGDITAIGKDMPAQVAEDIINSLKVFSHYFGPYPKDKLIAGEILLSHGEAFPGFLHLGFETWINTDAWGNDRIFRSHEVAHQWWGVGVGYETYHDQWLSEGFATYSSLLYLHKVAGIEKMFDRLKDFRNDIFSARKYLLGSGAESGPIAMGYRTSTSKTRGDYSLIVYKKGAYVLHMLRNMLIDFKTMNEDLFFQMMKEFYQSNRGKDIATIDFQLIAEKYSGIKLDWFFKQWVFGNDLPEIDFSYTVEPSEDNKTFTVHCRVVTKKTADDFKMFYPVEIRFKNNAKAIIRVFVDSPDFTFSLPNLQEKPKKIILNPFESVLARVNQ